MDFDNHHFVAFGVFITLWLLFQEITFSDILLPIFLASAPDVDLKLKFNLESHRNMFFHSLMIPLIIFIFHRDVLLILCILSFGLHCICDIRFKKVGGYYTLKLYGNVSVGGYWAATIWYIFNFLNSLGLLTVWLIFN